MNAESTTNSQDTGRPPVVDTRVSTGPDGMTYAAPFADVWDLIDAEIRARRNWDLVHADEERGLFTVVCRSLIPPSTDDLSVWVCLDEFGLTRVDVRSSARSGRRDFGANQRRVTAIFRALDEGLGTGSQVRR
jgi:hypothetical protein